MPGGRPTSFKPEYVDQAEKLCRLGAIDEEIADFFDVDVRTIYRWKDEHPEFCQALSESKEAADDRVRKSLYLNALGGNVTAQIFWLKNRKPGEWRDKVDHNHQADPDAPPVFTLKIDNKS